MKILKLFLFNISMTIVLIVIAFLIFRVWNPFNIDWVTIEQNINDWINWIKGIPTK